MAVDLAKLSLWLATLAKDHAFTFLDHNFRHGDSLVGLSLAQIEACHWSPDVQQAFVSASLRRRVAEAMKKRQEILTADEFTSYEKLSDLRVEADEPLEFLRFLGNAVLGVFFEGGTASAKERRRADLSLTIRDYLNDDDRHAHPARPAARHRTAGLRLARAGAVAASRSTGRSNSPRSSWRLAPDGSLERRADGGFDAMVGNPPFAGGEHDRGGACRVAIPTGSRPCIRNRTATRTSSPTSSAGRSTSSERRRHVRADRHEHDRPGRHPLDRPALDLQPRRHDLRGPQAAQVAGRGGCGRERGPCP